MKPDFNILFVGTGGQGILKASEVAALASMLDGFDVKKSELHGMSQRGGSVESHLRLGSRVLAPIIPDSKADFIVGLNKQESKRVAHFLKKGAVDLSSYLDKTLRDYGDRRTLNIFFLGILSTYLPIKEKSWLKAVKGVFWNRDYNLNIKAFHLGRELGGIR
jgi:indolepyruvate ferredoxin oxidoreductase, beta subunit